MMRAVDEVLTEIDAEVAPRLLVFSKTDLIDDERRRELRRRHPDAVLVSAVRGDGLERLKLRIEEEFARTLRPLELLIPFAEGGRLAELHALAGDLRREDTAEGVRVHVRLPATVADRYARFALATDGAAAP